MTHHTGPDQKTVKLAEARALLQSAQAVQAEAIAALESAIERSLKEGLNGLSTILDPVSDHRRAHRPGRPGRIDTDSELRAFVLARIERMTFVDLAEDVAKHFPPERRVGKSALHKWFHKNRHKSHPR